MGLNFEILCFLAAVSFLFSGNVYSASSPGNCSCIVKKTKYKINRRCGAIEDCKDEWNDLHQGFCPGGQKEWPGGPYTGPGCYNNYSSFKSGVCKEEGYQYEEESCDVLGLFCTCACVPACDSSCSCSCTTSDLCPWSKVEDCEISGNCVPGCLPATVGPCDECAPVHNINCVSYSFHDTFDVTYDDEWTATCTCTYFGPPCPPPPPPEP